MGGVPAAATIRVFALCQVSSRVAGSRVAPAVHRSTESLARMIGARASSVSPYTATMSIGTRTTVFANPMTVSQKPLRRSSPLNEVHSVCRLASCPSP